MKTGDVLQKGKSEVEVLAMCGRGILTSEVDSFDKVGCWSTEKELIKLGWSVVQPEWRPEKFNRERDEALKDILQELT